MHKTGQDRCMSRQTLMISFILDRVLGFPVLALTLRAIAFIYSTVYADYLPGSKLKDGGGLQRRERVAREWEDFQICGINCCQSSLSYILNVFPAGSDTKNTHIKKKRTQTCKYTHSLHMYAWQFAVSLRVLAQHRTLIIFLSASASDTIFTLTAGPGGFASGRYSYTAHTSKTYQTTLPEGD